MLNLSIGDPGPARDNIGPGIHDPQHARSLTKGLVQSSMFQDVVMDIYTGTCVFDFSPDLVTNGDVRREKLISLVPLGPHDGTGPNVDIQSYPGQATAIISASMTSFGDEPTGAAVDGALVQLETRSFPGHHLPAKVLVIQAEIGVEAGNLHRMAYQVTVLATTGEGGQELPGMILTLGPDQQVPPT